MTDTLYIRGIDQDIKAKLEKEARKKGMSLNKYIINILTDYAINPTLVTQEDKYANLVKDVSGMYQKLLTITREQLSENTHLLKDIKELLEDR